MLLPCGGCSLIADCPMVRPKPSQWTQADIIRNKRQHVFGRRNDAESLSLGRILPKQGLERRRLLQRGHEIVGECNRSLSVEVAAFVPARIIRSGGGRSLDAQRLCDLAHLRHAAME